MAAKNKDSFDEAVAARFVEYSNAGAELVIRGFAGHLMSCFGTDASGVSVGIAFVGKAFTEPLLLGYAYAFEQRTDARQVPALTPPLP